MRRLRFGSMPRLAVVFAALLLAGRLARIDGQPTPEAKAIAPFVLPDAAGKPWSLADHQGKKAYVVLFLGTQCPINNSYAPRLADLHKQYADKGVLFVAINSNHQDTAKDVADHAKKFGIPFPVLRDVDQKVADRFGAQRVPEAFVLDAAFKVVYHGRIDDQFGIGFTRPQPTRQDLVAALDEVLAAKKVSQPQTEVAGCYITRNPTPKVQTTVTYARDVSRILQNRCQECHRPGQIGPMPLLTYDDAAGWSAMIREVVRDKRMPPWHADPKYGHFTNDRSLTKAEHDTLLAWIDQGCPRGEDKDLPAPRTWPEGWSIGKPDMVITMPNTYKVPAKAPKGGIPYQHFMVKTKFDKDLFVQAIECKPGAPEVVHHIVLYAIIEGQPGFDGLSPLATWVPGDRGMRYAPGTARKIPKGTTLVFQMHYTPNGFAQEDRSSVGLILAKEPPATIIQSRIVFNQQLAIPPGAANHKVTGITTFPKDIDVYSLMPHMHLRGKSFDYTAIYPDGKRELLLSVPRYDFAWQTTYVLAKPVRLPAGTKLECVGHFDNSRDNPNNPDPTETVRWGLQTWQEMLAGVVEYSVVEDAEPQKN
jgi:peroxiredoxin